MLRLLPMRLPSVGEKFPEIFEEIRKVNTLDNELYYKGIQQNIINILDQAECRTHHGSWKEYDKSYRCSTVI